ncbi:MAG: hypothetical protein V3S18_02410 [Dehalococcoidia bacterium]
MTGRVATAAAGAPLLAGGWIVLWTAESYWNPLAFTALWTGAALLFWTGAGCYLGVVRHAGLAAVSIPFWWYFELVNARIDNWEYVDAERYGPVAYVLLASVAFATVVPAVTAAASLVDRLAPGRERDVSGTASRALPVGLIAAGLAAEAGVLIVPGILFPLVWVAPFLMLDGAVVALGGRSLSVALVRGPRRRALVIAAAGLLCGLLWEFWNFWAYPGWRYHVPGVGWAKVFEMPILGYGGYVPFAWSLSQGVALLALLGRRWGPRIGRG